MNDQIKRLCLQRAINTFTSDVQGYDSPEAVLAALAKAAMEDAPFGDLPDGIIAWEPFEHHSAKQIHALIVANAICEGQMVEEALKLQDPPRAVIVMNGGLVQHVIGDREIDAYIIDYDVEGADPDAVCMIPQGESYEEEASCRKEGVEVSPTSCDVLIKAILDDVRPEPRK